MEPYRRILLATDFSELSQTAVEHATMLARIFGAELHVIHILEVDIPVLPDGMVYTPVNFFEDFEKHAEKRLQEVVSTRDQNTVKVVTALLRGTPFLEIVNYARDKKIDLIVLGTHGRGALGHVLLGSVAERVVRKAQCAVLTVHPPQHKPDPGTAS